jgi:hypothetical protein
MTSVTGCRNFGKSSFGQPIRAMAIIQAGDGWQFRTEFNFEEIVWHNLFQLLNLTPLSRQFPISGKFCDILAVENSNRLVIVELKNIEDRYVVQQLVRYYDALKQAALPFDIDRTVSPRLIAIAPSFHADTLTDCKYSTLRIELITFSLESSSGGLSLRLSNASGHEFSVLQLPKGQTASESDIAISEPPHKLLNWLTDSRQVERAWVLALRQQLLQFDPRMKEIVEPTEIYYGRSKSKPCCELRKLRNTGYRRYLEYYLWLPDPENRPHVIKMYIVFDLDKQQVSSMGYCGKGHKLSIPWRFPQCIKQMKRFGYQRSLELYKPFLRANLTISPTNIVNLALKTWHSRI